LQTGKILEEFINWPEGLSWREVAGPFLVISVIGTFVSFIINKKVKDCPVFAVQLSVLLTLIVYPLVNTYLYVATLSDYEFSERIVDFPYGPFVFFVPLPVCILIATIFHIYREKKRAGDSSRAAPYSKSTKLRVIAWVLAILAGSFWLSYTMAIEKAPDHFTAFRFLAYTTCGFAAYLVVEIFLLVIRLLFAGTNRQEINRHG